MCLPISPKMIFVGKIDAVVPFLHLKSQPIKVTVSDIFVILGTSECPSEAEEV